MSPVATPPPVRLGARHRRALYASFTLGWVSGALWLLFHYFLQASGAFGPEPHVLEAWWLRLHGLAMMVLLVAAGTVVVHHAARAWQLRRQRAHGALLAGTLVWLALSGYALYYFSTDDNRAWLPLVHWLPGLAMPLALGLHIHHARQHHRHR